MRPGHFRGVCTIVLKLFLLTHATQAVFGKKDFQQCAVISRMVRDLNIDVHLDFVDTVREGDGLALSSRNVYLTPDQRRVAPDIYKALLATRAAVADGQSCAAKLRDTLEEQLTSIPEARVNYAVIVSGDGIQPVTEVQRGCVAAVAVWLCKTRLIDNLTLLET
jgi:pantoate--beta-alanine ligase